MQMPSRRGDLGLLEDGGLPLLGAPSPRAAPRDGVERGAGRGQRVVAVQRVRRSSYYPRVRHERQALEVLLIVPGALLRPCLRGGDHGALAGAALYRRAAVFLRVDGAAAASRGWLNVN